MAPWDDVLTIVFLGLSMVLMSIKKSYCDVARGRSLKLCRVETIVMPPLALQLVQLEKPEVIIHSYEIVVSVMHEQIDSDLLPWPFWQWHLK